MGAGRRARSLAQLGHLWAWVQVLTWLPLGEDRQGLASVCPAVPSARVCGRGGPGLQSLGDVHRKWAGEPWWH